MPPSDFEVIRTFVATTVVIFCCPSSCTSVPCKTTCTISDSALTLTPYVLPPGNKPSEASILVGLWDVCPSWCAIFHSLAAVRNCGKDPMEYLALVRMMNGNEPSARNAPRSVLFSGLLYTLACVGVEAIGLLQ